MKKEIEFTFNVTKFLEFLFWPMTLVLWIREQYIARPEHFRTMFWIVLTFISMIGGGISLFVFLGHFEVIFFLLTWFAIGEVIYAFKNKLEEK